MPKSEQLARGSIGIVSDGSGCEGGHEFSGESPRHVDTHGHFTSKVHL